MTKKRVLAAILLVVMTLGLLPATALAAGETGAGSYVVRLEADATSAKPADFGTLEADGRVWTDKNVSANGANFDVTLSALAQEYLRTGTTTTASSTAADVLLILDITSSMNKADVDGNYRYIAMVAAANKAMQTILDANDNNRVMVFLYGNNNVQKVFLPLDHYTTTSTYSESDLAGYGGVKKYIYYATSASDPKFSITVDSNTKNSSNVTGTAIHANQGYNGTGTYTQLALDTGIEALRSTIGAETYSLKRTPYVMLLTDGAANMANPEWWNVSPSSYTGLSGSTAQGAAATILTANYQKDQLTSAYRTYNTSNSWAGDTVFFSVGLGGDIPGDANVSAIVNPAEAVSTVVTQIGTYAQNGVTAGNIDYSSNYIYTTANESGSGYYSYTATGMNELNRAFSDLAGLVEEATRDVATPIAGSSTGGSIVFTDVLGEGMKLRGAPKLGTVTGSGTATGNTTAYAFTGYTSTVSYNSETRTLTWTLPADELPLIIFANRKNPAPGTYSNSNQSPIQLKYSVELANSVSLTGTYYSNAFNETGSTKTAKSTAVFTPTGDNKYYFDNVTADALAPEGYTSTPKTSFAAIAKAANITDTAENASTFSLDATSKLLTATLGNNGKLSVLAGIAKTVSPTSGVVAGDTLTYTITVNNLTSSPLADVVVTDTIPTGLAVGTINNGGTNTSGMISWTITSVPENGSSSVSFTATIPADAVGGKNYTNTAKITSISGDILDSPAVSSPVTSTVTPRYNTIVDLELNDSDWVDSGKSLSLGTDEASPTLVSILTAASGTNNYTAVVPAGTYRIYAGEIDTDVTVTVSDSGSNTATVDYYTLSLEAGDGTSNPASAGNYLSGQGVSLNADIATGYKWDKWESKTTGVSDINSKTGTVTMTKAITLKATATLITQNITIDVNKDDVAWTGADVPVITLVLAGDPDIVYNNGSALPPSEYKIFANGVDTKKTILIELDSSAPSGIKINENSTTAIDYYTLTLNTDAGTGNATGSGVYLSGTSVEIDAGVKPGYTWVMWNNDSTGGTNIAQKTTAVMVNRTLTFTATSKVKKDSTLPATLVITGPTVPKTIPTNFGGTTTLSVTATNATSYQWYIDRNDGMGFIPLVGATDASYTISPVTLENSTYQYYCVAMNATGRATSPIFTLMPQIGVPKTDNSLPGLWAGIAIIAAAGLAAAVVLRRRNHKA